MLASTQCIQSATAYSPTWRSIALWQWNLHGQASTYGSPCFKRYSDIPVQSWIHCFDYLPYEESFIQHYCHTQVSLNFVRLTKCISRYQWLIQQQLPAFMSRYQIMYQMRTYHWLHSFWQGAQEIDQSSFQNNSASSVTVLQLPISSIFPNVKRYRQQHQDRHDKHE